MIAKDSELNEKEIWGGGTELRGEGGFESGSESHTSTIECRVASNSPHSQGGNYVSYTIVVGFCGTGRLNKNVRNVMIIICSCSSVYNVQKKQ
jgi:hypothetical protein